MFRKMACFIFNVSYIVQLIIPSHLDVGLTPALLDGQQVIESKAQAEEVSTMAIILGAVHVNFHGSKLIEYRASSLSLRHI